MTLQSKIEHITEAGFNRMPKKIANVLTQGIKELKESNIRKEVLDKVVFPTNIDLYNEKGETIILGDLNHAKFTIINFYRGGWCPYCNLELRAYESLKSEFEKARANIIAISPELPEHVQVTTQKNAITYPVLTDLNGLLAKELGLSFSLNDSLKAEYQNFGINLQKLHGNSNNELLIPAVYVVDQNFKILKVYMEEDHMQRAEPSVILHTLLGLNSES